MSPADFETTVHTNKDVRQTLLIQLWEVRSAASGRGPADDVHPSRGRRAPVRDDQCAQVRCPHVLTKRPTSVKPEMALEAIASTLTWVIDIVGMALLMRAIRALSCTRRTGRVGRRIQW